MRTKEGEGWVGAPQLAVRGLRNSPSTRSYKYPQSHLEVGETSHFRLSLPLNSPKEVLITTDLDKDPDGHGFAFYDREGHLWGSALFSVAGDSNGFPRPLELYSQS